MKKPYLFILVLVASFLCCTCSSENAVTDKDPEKSVVREAYLDVLSDRQTFYRYTNFSNGQSEDIKEAGYQGEINSLSELLADYSEDEIVFNVEKFTVVDMETDGVPELIMELSLTGDRIIFHYDAEGIYAFSYSYRGMNALKKDGTFLSSDGAAYNQFNRMQFQDNVCSNIVLAYSDVDKDGEVIFFINDEEVSSDKFDALWEGHDQKEDAEWYPYSEDNNSENLISAWDSAAR